MTPRGPARLRMAGASRTGWIGPSARPAGLFSVDACGKGGGASRRRACCSIDRAAFVSGGASMSAGATDALRGQEAIHMEPHARACDGLDAARGVTVLRLAYNADAAGDGALPAVMRDAVYVTRDDRSGPARARNVARESGGWAGTAPPASDIRYQISKNTVSNSPCIRTSKRYTAARRAAVSGSRRAISVARRSAGTRARVASAALAAASSSK